MVTLNVTRQMLWAVPASSVSIAAVTEEGVSVMVADRLVVVLPGIKDVLGSIVSVKITFSAALPPLLLMATMYCRVSPGLSTLLLSASTARIALLVTELGWPRAMLCGLRH